MFDGCSLDKPDFNALDGEEEFNGAELALWGGRKNSIMDTTGVQFLLALDAF
jgi:hypothetical protein